MSVTNCELPGTEQDYFESVKYTREAAAIAIKYAESAPEAAQNLANLYGIQLSPIEVRAS